MPEIRFGPFIVKGDPANLWRGDEQIPLRPKSLDVLRYLAERPGNLVSKEELLSRVWPGRIISDSGVRLCIREIRNALGDDAKAPQYLETVAGKGYRFLEGRDGRAVLADMEKTVIGRESDLARLEDFLQLVVNGEQHFVLVSGEPGIGKTTLLELFLENVSERYTAQVIQAQCIVHFGPSEAYGPILEAINEVCGGEDGARYQKALRRVAPGWLQQLPGLLKPYDSERLLAETAGMTPERMIREFRLFASELSEEKPLIFAIEDLHWADSATIDLLASLMEHSIPSLLVVGTYRPADAVLYSQPLRSVINELKGRGHCNEMSLELLTEKNIAEYLSSRLNGKVAEELVAQVFRRTSGNPLFLVNLIEDLIQVKGLEKTDDLWIESEGSGNLENALPESLRSIISRRLDGLISEQRQVLEVASVAGFEFNSAIVARILEQSYQETDSVFEYLGSNGLFVESHGIMDFPNGTISGSYEFQHPMYLEVLYDSIGDARKVHIHRGIGELLESLYGDQAETIAPVIAMHFDQGLNSEKAVNYYQLAAAQSLGRNAYTTTVEQLSDALRALENIPESHDRHRQELEILMLLGPVQIAIEGYASSSAKASFERALSLSTQLDLVDMQIPTLWNLAGLHMGLGQLGKSHSLIERLDEPAGRSSDPHIDMIVADAHAQQFFFEGKLSESLERCEVVVSQYDVVQHSHLAETYSQEDPGAVCNGIAALVHWMMGLPDQSTKKSQALQELSGVLDNPHTTAFGLFFLCAMCQLQRDFLTTERLAEDWFNLSEAHDMVHFQAVAQMHLGWARAQHSPGEPQLELVRNGLKMLEDTGTRLLLPHSNGILAQTQLAVGNLDEAQRTIVEALVVTEENTERWSEAELHRVQGEIIAADGTEDDTSLADCFEKSLQVAKGQQARSLELRAALNLGQVYFNRGQAELSSELLSPYASLFDKVLTPDERRLAKQLVNPKT